MSSAILHATRHRWIVQTIFTWSFIATIAFRFIPNSIVTRPIAAVWVPFVQEPFFTLPRYLRYCLGWLALLAIILGSAFGFKLQEVGRFLFFFQRISTRSFIFTIYIYIHSSIHTLRHSGHENGDRAISVLGLLVFQSGFWATSKHRSHIQWRIIIVGLFMQQACCTSYALMVEGDDNAFSCPCNAGISSPISSSSSRSCKCSIISELCSGSSSISLGSSSRL